MHDRRSSIGPRAKSGESADSPILPGGKTFETGHETWAVIPPEVVEYNNNEREASLWTERTLRKIRR